MENKPMEYYKMSVVSDLCKSEVNRLFHFLLFLHISKTGPEFDSTSALSLARLLFLGKELGLSYKDWKSRMQILHNFHLNSEHIQSYFF